MFKKGYYTDKSENDIRDDVKQEGFNPLKISNTPGFVYHKHKHPETKLLVFLEGSMIVTVKDTPYHCEKGDRLIIPGNTEHAAVVGSDGCLFFWSEVLR